MPYLPSRSARMGPVPDPAPLADVAPGARVVLVATSAEPRRALRLAELGLRPGSRLVVLSRTPGGGRVVGVGHARIALGRGLTRRLHVAPETA